MLSIQNPSNFPSWTEAGKEVVSEMNIRETAAVMPTTRIAKNG
jgi:hypothetical protein